MVNETLDVTASASVAAQASTQPLVIQMNDFLKTLKLDEHLRLIPFDFKSKVELENLLSSICLAFVDLIDILLKTSDPAVRSQKYEDIYALNLNFIFILNNYRAYQTKTAHQLFLQRNMSKIADLIKDFDDTVKKLDKSDKMLLKDLKSSKIVRVEYYKRKFLDINMAAGQHLPEALDAIMIASLDHEDDAATNFFKIIKSKSNVNLKDIAISEFNKMKQKFNKLAISEKK